MRHAFTRSRPITSLQCLEYAFTTLLHALDVIEFEMHFVRSVTTKVYVPALSQLPPIVLFPLFDGINCTQQRARLVAN